MSLRAAYPPTVAAPEHDPFAPRPLRPPAPAAGRTGAGPVALLVSGAVALVLAVVVAVLGGRLLLSTLPLGVLDAQGRPGPDVVAEAPAPGTAEVTLAADTTYTVLLRSLPRGAGLDGDLAATGPDGTDVRVRRSSISLETTRGGQQARAVAELTTGEAGVHVLVVPAPTDASPASVLLVESTGAGALLGGVLGTVASVLAALTLGALGIGLVVGGLIWRQVRRRPRSAVV